MSPVIDCFFLEPSDQADESLRRFAFGDNPVPCVSGWGHDASVHLGQVAYPASQAGRGADDFDHADPRWPTGCKHCGYVLQPVDPWQHNLTRLYKRRDTGELMTLASSPVGAMWDADWLRRIKTFAERITTDGLMLVVKTPGGEWNIDGPSSNGSGWERSGAVPHVTATPSIVIGKRDDGVPLYHGWLRNGQLIEC